MSESLLVLGLVFSTATQFRLSGTSVGPGVLFLMLFVVAIGVRAGLSGARPDGRPALVMVAFWSIMALALSGGMITAIVTGELFDSGLVLHDVAAYALVAVMSFLCVVAPLRLRRVCWMLAVGAALSLFLQLLCAFGVMHIPGIEPWYWSRMRGWSDNPNQLAIGCFISALLAWHLADTAERWAARLAAVALLIPPLIAGRMSGSDTFMAALAASVPVWMVMKLIVWMRDVRAGKDLRAVFARLSLLALPALLICLVPVVMSRAAEVEAFAMSFAKKGGAEAASEMSLRFTLWRGALERGIESGMLGLGPGPHLQVPAQIAAAHANDTPLLHHAVPPQNGTADYESHNTLLDVFTQGGLLALGSFMWLLMRAIKGAYRARRAGLLCMMSGVVVFMMTDNIIRQPLVWFVVVLCLRSLDWNCAASGESDRYGPVGAALRAFARRME